MQNEWTAHWIWSRERGGFSMEARRFRRRFRIENPPASLLVQACADSRYKLYLNGALLGRGPVKGNRDERRYDSYELAPFLRTGENVLAAEVRCFGLANPTSEVHTGTPGFLLQAPSEAGLDTPGDWRVAIDETVEADTGQRFHNAMNFLGHLESVRLAPGGDDWLYPEFDDSSWEEPLALLPAAEGDNRFGCRHKLWPLAPRPIPALTEEWRDFATCYRLEGGRASAQDRDKPLAAPPNETATFVFDAGALTTGYPVLDLRGGDGATLRLTYVESALEALPESGRPWRKGRRDRIEGSFLEGYHDALRLSGGGSCQYEPFHWRTFRFLKITVETGDAPLQIEGLRYRFTTFPQTRVAAFECGDPLAGDIADISWRTLQLCSHETYEDCPYYEQLNYIHDTRNEALESYALCGEALLARRCIELYRDTARWDGLVESRVPSASPQRIPIFCFWWIKMVEDHWLWIGEPAREVVRSCLHAIDGVLTWFRNYRDKEGFVGKLDYWNPVGGVGSPNTSLQTCINEGRSIYVLCLYLMGLKAAMRLHRDCGYVSDAARWKPLAEELQTLVRERGWSEGKGCFLESPDRPDDPLFSQHTQAEAVLCGAATEEQRKALEKSFLDPARFEPMARQHGYHKALAMKALGLGAGIPREIAAEFKPMLEAGLTTAVESRLESGRSDCHAWSAWPPLAYLTQILGVEPAAPGFGAVSLRPELGAFPEANGSLPTPKGPVTASWRREGAALRFQASVPEGVEATVELPGKRLRLERGGAIDERIDEAKTAS